MPQAVINQASGHAHTKTNSELKYRTTNVGNPLSHQDVDDNFEILRLAVNGLVGDISGLAGKSISADLSGALLGYTENGKNYPVELGSNSGESSNARMYVNVPWTDTNTTYSTATASALGLVKFGYTESGKNYPVELSNGQMYVNVPWTDTDTNTTYGIATSTTAGLVKSGGDITVNADGTMSSSGGANVQRFFSQMHVHSQSASGWAKITYDLTATSTTYASMKWAFLSYRHIGGGYPNMEIWVFPNGHPADTWRTARGTSGTYSSYYNGSTIMSNGTFKGGYMVAENESDKAQYLGGQIMCPVNNGKLYIQVYSTTTSFHMYVHGGI